MTPRWIDIERLIHSFKTAVACVIGFLLTKLIGFPADQWVVITIIVVMCAQIYVGSVVQKAYLRFLGTLAGCLFATTVIIVLGHQGWIVAAAIGVSTFIFSYLATGQESTSYAGTLGAVTVALILISQTPTVTFAAERMLEINVGLLIAAVISQFFLPIHARTHLRRSQASTLAQLIELYQKLMITQTEDNKTINTDELDENIAKTLLKQRQLAKESVREPLAAAFDPLQFMESLYCEKEMLRAMVFMHRAQTHISTARNDFLTQPGLKHYNDMVIDALVILKKAIENNKTSKEHFHSPSLTRLKSDIQQQMSSISKNDQIYIDGFIFAAEILSQSLTKFAVLCDIPLYKEVAEPSASN